MLKLKITRGSDHQVLIIGMKINVKSHCQSFTPMKSKEWSKKTFVMPVTVGHDKPCGFVFLSYTRAEKRMMFP